MRKVREVTIAPPEDSQITAPNTGNFGGMFAVDPKADCPHLQHEFTLDKSKQDAIKSKLNKFSMKNCQSEKKIILPP